MFVKLFLVIRINVLDVARSSSGFELLHMHVNTWVAT